MKRLPRFDVTVYLAITLFFAEVVASIFAAPFLITAANRVLLGAGLVIYNVFTWFCHQLPERSFSWFGTHFPLDARMTGIFIGSLLGLLSPLVFRYRNSVHAWLIGALLIVPMAVDGGSQTILLLRESNNLLRVATGLMAGFGLFSAVAFELLRDQPARLKAVSDRRALRVAVLANLVFVVAMVLASGIAGRNAISGRQAQNVARWKAAEAGESAPILKIFYLAPNAVLSIETDPYLRRYDDAVLTDASDVRAAYPLESAVKMLWRPLVSPHGVWVVALIDRGGALDGRSTHFLPPTTGRYFYIDGVSGKILKEIRR